jgi:tetratricopeptide (TPR) repeat protein
MRATAIVLGPLLLLGLLEGALRVAGYGHPTAFLIRSSTGKGWTVNDRFTKRFYPHWSAGNSNPFLVPDAKTSNAVRIIVLGESAALGTPSPAFSFSRILGVMLRRQFPDQSFEIFNAAMRGINSHIIRPIARDCARHQPDLFIVYMGNNELVGLHGASPDATLVDRHLTLLRLLHGLQGTRLGQLLSALKGNGPRLPQDMEFFRRQRIAADSPEREPAYRHFAANVGDVCDFVHKSGAEILLLTVASNLKDCPPLASLHKSGLTAEQLNAWDTAYRAGINADAAGRFAEAVKHFEMAAAVDDHFADLHFRLARSHLADGRKEEASQHFALARDLDALPFRAHGRLNAILRATAQARSSSRVSLLDIEESLVTANEPVPGNNVFLDHVHFRFAGDYAVARALLPAVTASLRGRLGSSQTKAVPSLEECAIALGYNGWEEREIAHAVVQQLSRPPFLDQLDHAERQARAERELQESSAAFSMRDLERAREISRAAAANNPEDWQLHYNYGRMALLTGDHAAAATHLQAVVAQFPDWIPPRMSFGNALARLGRRWEAESQFQACLRLDRGFTPARQALTALEGGRRR